MRANQHESTRHENAKHESAKYGKPNIQNIIPNLMLKVIFVQLIKSPTLLLLLRLITIIIILLS